MSSAIPSVVASLPVAGTVAAAGAAATAPAATAAPVVARTPSVAPAAATTTAQVGTPAHVPASPAGAGSLGGAVFALVLVVGLILALSWLARRMPGLGGAAGVGHPSLRIVGALALGPRDRLVVVEVGDTQLLLGVGAGGTRTLHTLDQPLPTEAKKATPAFAQLLARHLGKKP
ncbi:MAG TPA: flagellar biosynthetic protein FliO [Luteimonas sp.]|nr:flagellar biosynthetic protein FliO [Luteimonas sp.]